MNRDGLLANIADAGKVAPFQPWAKGLYEYRQRNLLKDDPMASCLPPGGPRQFQVPYGLQILEAAGAASASSSCPAAGTATGV